MAILHVEEIRDMTPAEREAEVEELRTELLNAKAIQSAGGAPENPGRTKQLRRTIARIKTIQREEGDHESRSDSERASGGNREQHEDEE
ncbi:50S ribosomal protein L29 [Halobacteriales archaeon QH_7_66_36]|nr:MAG: 50S ribosomal protein L29 [Halobacteriales archaeon QH_7_66_36]